MRWQATEALNRELREVLNSGALAEVGPRVCDNPSLQQAFNQFHVNVHNAALGQGPAAPGLHNGFGADLEVHGCSFVP
jgi:hypothetical protein